MLISWVLKIGAVVLDDYGHTLQSLCYCDTHEELASNSLTTPAVNSLHMSL